VYALRFREDSAERFGGMGRWRGKICFRRASSNIFATLRHGDDDKDDIPISRRYLVDFSVISEKQTTGCAALFVFPSFALNVAARLCGDYSPRVFPVSLDSKRDERVPILSRSREIMIDRSWEMETKGSRLRSRRGARAAELRAESQLSRTVSLRHASYA